MAPRYVGPVGFRYGGGYGGGYSGGGGGGGGGGYKGGGYGGRGGDSEYSHAAHHDGKELGRNLRQKDWKSILPTLKAFKKDFYNEHETTARRTDAEVAAFRESSKITCRGHDVPKPILSFDEAKFPAYVRDTLIDEKFDAPTPIQAQGWYVNLYAVNHDAPMWDAVSHHSRRHVRSTDGPRLTALCLTVPSALNLR